MTKLIQTRSIDPKKLKAAKHMYMSGISALDIAEELEIALESVGYMIFGSDKSGNDPECWYRERINNQNNPEFKKSFTPYVKSKRHVLSFLESQLVNKITESALELCDESSPNFDIQEMKLAVDMYRELDKINRLENDKPTDIVEAKHGLTLREIQNGQTPAIEVEAKVINKENEDERRSSRRSKGREEGSEEKGEKEVPKGFYFPKGALAGEEES